MASILYRASPIDPALKPASSTQTPDLVRFDSPSDVSTSPPTGSDIPKPFSPALPDLNSIGKFDFRDNFPDSVSVSTSLPGLAALASVASAPTSNLRYVPGKGNENGSWESGVLEVYRPTEMISPGLSPLLFSAESPSFHLQEGGPISAENALADRVIFLTILQGIQCEREHGEHELRDIVTSGYDSRTEQRSGEFTLFTLFTWQFHEFARYRSYLESGRFIGDTGGSWHHPIRALQILIEPVKSLPILSSHIHPPSCPFLFLYPTLWRPH